MFGSIGLLEIAIIAGIALMVLGPEKFPEFAKMAARFMRDIKKYTNEVQHEISKEINPVKKELDDLRRVDPEKYIDSLIDDDEEGDNNIEPDPTTMDFYSVDPGGDETAADSPEPAEESVGEEEAPKAETSDPVAYDPYDDGYPYEETQEPVEPETPERLDG